VALVGILGVVGGHRQGQDAPTGGHRAVHPRCVLIRLGRTPGFRPAPQTPSAAGPLSAPESAGRPQMG
jgi:hypothetical protein